jgi:large subunit ribosomal protein L21
MFAIVQADGRQYQLETGRFIDCDLIEGDQGDAFVFDRVLMIVDGAQSIVGNPFLEGAKVKGRILAHKKGRKIIVYKQRPKKGTRKKQGHRQQTTRVIIDSIELKDKVLAKSDPSQVEKARAERGKPSSEKAKVTKAKKSTAPKESKTAKKREKAEPEKTKAAKDKPKEKPKRKA